MKLSMIPLARAEMLRAARWYDHKGAGLGDRLLDDIRASMLAILEFPAAFPQIGAPFRKKLLDVFPYALIYRVDADEIVIIAVPNLKRRPRYWARRVKAQP